VTITHHLDPATVLAFAAGTLNEAHTVVAASHVAVCAECRRAVASAESLGGEIMRVLDGTEVSDACRDGVFSRLDQASLHRFPRKPARKADVPEPLAAVIGDKALSDLAWKRKAPGVEIVDLPLPRKQSGKLFLMRIGPGRSMPEHGHGGEEMTLILEGSYTDKFGRFGRGDIADLGDDVEHQPVVDRDRACICLVATEAPTRFRSWPARILQPLIGI
jgi:putative transcriptional regulator